MGMTYLHSFSAIHRDLKPQNLLVFFPFSVKICDFGFMAAISDTDLSMTPSAGTMRYRAPEVYTNKYESRCDIYSFGIIMATLNGIPRPEFKKINSEDESQCADALDILEEQVHSFSGNIGRAAFAEFVQFRYEAKVMLDGLCSEFPELITCLNMDDQTRFSFHELLKKFVLLGLHEKMERTDTML
jgi:serine/threonine protein kinase